METVWANVLPYQRALAGSMAGLIMVDGLRPSSSRGVVDVRPYQSMYYRIWTGEQENGRVGETDDV